MLFVQMKIKSSIVMIVVLSIIVVISFLFFKKNLSGNVKNSTGMIVRFLLLPGCPIHFLKTQRERFAELFVFGDYDTSSWHTVLANKRMAEAEELLEYKRFGSSVKLFLKAEEEAELGFVFLKKAAGKGEDVNYLKEEIRKNLFRQQKYLENIKDMNSILQKDRISDISLKIKDQLNELSF